jgi:serine/threonine protein kinase
MALAPGARLGVYEVVGPLGRGGMGEVWRATDTKLRRDVALKILPDAFAHDPDRLARFEREARALASLNHPHIAQVYGLEESRIGGSSDPPALVMELVEGPTLADRIARGPIPVDEARPIAKQIAAALEAAHEQGIVHRDLRYHPARPLRDVSAQHLVPILRDPHYVVLQVEHRVRAVPVLRHPAASCRVGG